MRSPAADISADQWEQVIGTNLTGAFWVAQAAARRMHLAGHARVLRVRPLVSIEHRDRDIRP